MNHAAFLRGYLNKEADLSDIIKGTASPQENSLLNNLTWGSGAVGAAVGGLKEPEEGISQLENTALGVTRGLTTGLGANAGARLTRNIAKHLNDGELSTGANAATLAGGALAGGTLGNILGKYLNDASVRHVKKLREPKEEAEEITQ